MAKNKKGVILNIASDLSVSKIRVFITKKFKVFNIINQLYSIIKHGVIGLFLQLFGRKIISGSTHYHLEVSVIIIKELAKIKKLIQWSMAENEYKSWCSFYVLMVQNI